MAAPTTASVAHHDLVFMSPSKLSSSLSVLDHNLISTHRRKMKMHRRTTKRGTYSNWNSEEGKAKIKQSVQKWFAEFNGTMFLIDYAKKEGIPVTTLRRYCHNDVTKRKSVDDIKVQNRRHVGYVCMAVHY